MSKICCTFAADFETSKFYEQFSNMIFDVLAKEIKLIIISYYTLADIPIVGTKVW